MEQVTIGSACPNSNQFFLTNAAPANSSYPTLVNLATDPSNTAGYISINNGSYSATPFADFTFWGVGTAGQTFNAQIVGYRMWNRPNGANEFEYLVLADILCTLGNGTSIVTTTDKLVSNITLNSGISVASCEIPPIPSNAACQHLELDLKGCQIIRLVPGTGNVTSLNGKFGGF